MQFTKSIVATALALFASSAVATTVDIAYTSNGVYYNQQVESDVRTSLSQPYYGQEVYYAAAGATNINPPVDAAFVQCQDPSST
ncbi:uncharacterized protein An13g01510 [Aspergillus niger]|uniref:Contig An13c0060, genomic contig n=2 Tax=Aspergillus niger TaxID=5061 RepID=A2R1K1_ASPNC|nr:uncharacterized protein An13g01510 [Aspergillus niger]CAK41551.1 unnamed protein product [Aspergillus niger]